MFSFTLPRFALTAALSLATLAAGIVIPSEAKCITPTKAEQSLTQKRKKLQAAKKHNKKAHTSKTTSAKRVGAADTANNYSSINGKHAQKLNHVRNNSVKVTTSAANPGEEQYQAELRDYEQKKREYEKSLAEYEARKRELKSKTTVSGKPSASAAKPVTATKSTSATLSAPAAAPTAVSTAVAPAPENKPASFTDSLILKYDGSYEGPAIQTMGAYKPNGDGTTSTDPQDLTNIITLGYKLSPNFNLKAGPMFITPLAGNGDVTWLDPFLRLDINNLYNRGPVNFGMDLRFYPGVSDGSKKAGRMAMIRNTQILSVDLGKGFAFAWTSYVRFSALKTEGFEDAKQGADWKIYVDPLLAYSFTETLAGTLQWEAATSHAFGEDPGFNMGSSGQLKIGVAWTPIAQLEFDPMIGMATGSGTRLFDGRSAQLLMDFTIKAF